MLKYVLQAFQFDQVLARDEKGRAIEKIRHRQGSIISNLDAAEAERLLRAGAIAYADASNVEGGEVENSEDDSSAPHSIPEDAPGSTSTEPPTSPAKDDRPKNAAPKPIWEAYALKRGIENAAELNKDELVAAVNALDAK